ncbi:MAG: CDP-diacylglycerol--glycerol-3-phosphate 3-phosphatidyltransferase [Eubacteriales bacterium]|nr:CDP-diacylglycerol--glycerol-3-phosphate 3-phosphatidyltransferase [Eubacteriales bacterium]
MNLPNQLTLLRVVLVPVTVVFLLFPRIFGMGENAALWARLAAAAAFSLTALTDMLDGKIARKYHLITNFGKFMDPLADKFMVFSVLVAMCVSELFARFHTVLAIVTMLVILRELAVTSLRLLAASSEDGAVIAANRSGKIKTVSQILFLLCMMLEPCGIWLLNHCGVQVADTSVLSWITMIFMTFMTVYSGLAYLVGNRKYINFSQ